MLGSPADVVECIDASIAPVIATVGPVAVDRLIDEAMMRLHAEERELQQYEALDTMGVFLDERSINHTAIAELIVKGDWKDLWDFNNAVTLIAAALGVQGSTEPLNARRALAVGILAGQASAASPPN